MTDLAWYTLEDLERLLQSAEAAFSVIQATVVGLPRAEIPASRVLHLQELTEKIATFRAEIERRHKNTASQSNERVPVAAIGSPPKILFLGAAPDDQIRLALGKEVGEISRSLRESELGRRVELIQEWAVRPRDLQAIILRHTPHIIHFSGHGGTSGELMFEDDDGSTRSAPIVALGRLFASVGHQVRCVILNACFSLAQAQAINDHVDIVIGMKTSVSDAAAIAFSSSLYLALGHGYDFGSAFSLGCNQIELLGINDADVPRLLARPNVHPHKIGLRSK